METALNLLIPALFGVLILRLLAKPLQLLMQYSLQAAGGYVCLWLLNLVSGLTGISIPVNAVTVDMAGFLGLPGILGAALLQLL